MTMGMIEATPDGRIVIGSTIRLADGTRRRQGVQLDGANLAWFADQLEAWMARPPSTDLTYQQGTDAISFRYGGTDYQPVVTIVNHGPNRGSLFISPDDVTGLVAAMRAFVQRSASPANVS